MQLSHERLTFVFLFFGRIFASRLLYAISVYIYKKLYVDRNPFLVSKETKTTCASLSLTIHTKEMMRDEVGGGGTVCAAPVAVCLCIRECPSTNIHAVYVYSHMKDGRVCAGYRRKGGNTPEVSFDYIRSGCIRRRRLQHTTVVCFVCVILCRINYMCTLSLSIFYFSLW